MQNVQGTPRRYGFAWLMCRQRKIKCYGKKPNCAKCLKAKELCKYKESSFTTRMIHQLHQSKRPIEQLESQFGTSRAHSYRASRSGNPRRARGANTEFVIHHRKQCKSLNFAYAVPGSSCPLSQLDPRTARSSKQTRIHPYYLFLLPTSRTTARSSSSWDYQGAAEFESGGLTHLKLKTLSSEECTTL